jgi:hypothetical protein
VTADALPLLADEDREWGVVIDDTAEVLFRAFDDRPAGWDDDQDGYSWEAQQ